MALPTNADVIVVHGYWLDELTGLGVKQDNGRPATIMFDPVPLLGANAAKTPNLRDLTSNAHLKTRTRVATVDPVTGYYAAQLVASNDPDLDAYSGRKVTFLGEDPFTIEVPYNAPTVTVSAEMAAKTGLTQGSSVKAIWLPNASVTTIPTPTPPNSYLSSAQTLANIAAGIETHDEDPAAHADIRALIPAAYTDEQARDALAATLVAGSNVTITPNDGADTITIGVTLPSAYTDEQAQDAFAALIAAGTHSGISFAYNDAGNAISATVTAQTWSQITGKPTFAAVATSGSASDITTGTLPDAVIPAGIARDSEVATAVANLVNSAPTTLDTLGEVATALQADESAAATLTATVGGKAAAFTQSATKTANYTAADNEIVPLDTSGGTFTLTGPTSGKPFGFRWKAGPTAPTIAAPSGYTISGAATVTPGLAPATSSGELVLWQAFSGDYQPIGGLKPQSALNTLNDAKYKTVWSVGENLSATWTSGSDATSALLTTVAAAPSGAVITFPHGSLDFAISQVVSFKAGQRLVGNGGTRIIQKVWPDHAAFLTWAGTDVTTDTTTLTADVAAGSRTLTVASTSALTVGSTYLLGSNAAFDANAINPTMWRGEQVVVDSITDSTTVALRGYVRASYAVADAASLQLMTFFDGGGASDIEIVNPEPTQHYAGMLSFRTVDKVRVERVTMTGSDETGIEIDNCRDVHLLGVRGYDFTDNDPATQWGYVISIMRATHDVRITAPYGRHVRHVVTTNGRGNKRGVPHDVVVTGGVGDYGINASFDSHPQGQNIVYAGCTANNITGGPGFHIRARNSQVVGGSASNCAIGLQLDAGAHFASIGGGFTVRNTRRDTVNSVGGYALSINACTDVTIGDVTIDGASYGGLYVLNACDRLHVGSGYKAFNVSNSSANVYSGIRFENTTTGDRIVVHGALVGGPTGQAKYAVEVASGAALTNTSITDVRGYGLGTGVASAPGLLVRRCINLDSDPIGGTARADLVATAQGFAGETFPRSLLAGSFTIATGDQRGTLVGLRGGETVTNLWLQVNTAGAGITLLKLGLWSLTGTLLASTADLSAQFAATGIKGGALSTAYTVPADGGYYVGVVFVGTTGPGLMRGTSGVSGYTASALGSGSPPSVSSSGKTDIGAMTVGGSGTAPWVAWT